MNNVKQNLLDEAGKIVNGARRKDYGTPEDNFARIAKFWQAYMENTGRAEAKITAADVSPLMRLMKEARLCESPSHRDSFVDIIGYTLTGAEINLDEESVKFSGRTAADDVAAWDARMEKEKLHQLEMEKLKLEAEKMKAFHWASDLTDTSMEAVILEDLVSKGIEQEPEGRNEKWFSSPEEYQAFLDSREKMLQDAERIGLEVDITEEERAKEMAMKHLAEAWDPARGDRLTTAQEVNLEFKARQEEDAKKARAQEAYKKFKMEKYIEAIKGEYSGPKVQPIPPGPYVDPWWPGNVDGDL